MDGTDICSRPGRCTEGSGLCCCAWSQQPGGVARGRVLCSTQRSGVQGGQGSLCLGGITCQAQAWATQRLERLAVGCDVMLQPGVSGKCPSGVVMGAELSPRPVGSSVGGQMDGELVFSRSRPSCLPGSMAGLLLFVAAAPGHTAGTRGCPLHLSLKMRCY